MKIVADRAIPFLAGVFEPWAEVHYLAGGAFRPEDVAEADALIVRTRTRCTEELLAGSRVKLVATATIGFDHIDRCWCREHGVVVETAAGCNARGVLQWVAGVLAHLARKEGWRPEERTLGVVGVGHVGSLVSAYARRWGFRVLESDPPRAAREPDFVSLSIEELASRCDLLTFHTPLDQTTRHLCNEALLARLPRHGVVINSSRGEVVDNRALCQSGLTACLDVWEGEPSLDAALLARAEVATPHIAGYSLQGKAQATALAVRAVARHFHLPLTEWYPAGMPRSEARSIFWEELCSTIGGYFDVEAESRQLKESPERFEGLREGYRYRKEYF